MSKANIIPGRDGTVNGPFQKVWTGLVTKDGTNIDIGSSSEGNLDQLNTSDKLTQQLLTDILKEVKIMNLHLSILTDNTIKKTEVE